MWYQVVEEAEEEMRARLAARGLDTSVPNVARIYDFMLDGKDNFAADRDAAERVMREIPHSALACRQNRDFLGRVMRHLTAQGIRQFLDIGSGLPTRENVHEIVQRADPDARVVYVDFDPVVVTHAEALLVNGSDGVLVVEGDARDPGKIISDAKGLIDFSQPVAVLLFAILHFLTDADDPHGIVGSLAAELAPGSAVSISHLTGEGTEPDKGLAAQEVYQGASAPAVPRSRKDITRFFDGLDLIDPGVTDINLWPVRSLEPAAPLTFYGGVARKHLCARAAQAALSQQPAAPRQCRAGGPQVPRIPGQDRPAPVRGCPVTPVPARIAHSPGRPRSEQGAPAVFDSLSSDNLRAAHDAARLLYENHRALGLDPAVIKLDTLRVDICVELENRGEPVTSAPAG